MRPPLSEEADRRRRELIVQTARELLAESPADIAMRRLADRCRLNVATIYHHFPSKAELLRAVVAEQRYLERLPDAIAAPLDLEVPPRPRMRRWLTWLWAQAAAEFPLWRLVLGEGIRGEVVARGSLTQLSAGLGSAIDLCLATLFPEIDEPDRARAARLIRSTTFAVCLEGMLYDGQRDDAEVLAADLERRAEDLAELLFR
jgi:AcrR family transcriptional regulator